MPLPLHELAGPTNDPNRSIVRLTENGIEFFPASPQVEVKTTLIPIVLSNLVNSTVSTST
jgi:hypothetical protein